MFLNSTFFYLLIYQNHIWILKFINCQVNNGVVLLLGVVSLMAGSTTGVPMSPGYGGYQSTPLPCRLTIKHQLSLLQLTTLRLSSATPPRLQITTPQLMLPQANYAECPKYFFPSCTTKGSSITSRLPSSTSQKHRSTITVEYYTESWVNIFFIFSRKCKL
jgi:hypothetical protein